MTRKRDFLFTSESVTEGHPDKMADQISDAILDAMIADDPKCRTAIETLLKTGIVIVAGEVTTSTYVEIPDIVREVIKNIGYTRAKYGFDYETCGVMSSIGKQSPNIAQGVNKAYEARVGNGYENEFDTQGAGDQGMMFGYACNETEEFMPLPIQLAHRLSHRLSEVRKAGILPYLRPDGKTQVTVRYENDRPVSVETIVIASQHAPNIDIETQITPDIKEFVIKPIVPQEYLSKDLKLFVNPTGEFTLGGPMGDTGVTGRKIIIDTYGGMARHGGGCFSGKDPSKVDRSATYAVRYVAKNLVASGAASRLEIEVAYAIGVSHPVSVMVETFGTEKVDVKKIEKAVKEIFDLRPAAIIKNLNLLRPIYRKTAAYGHFGRRDRDFTWEKLDKVDEIKSFLGLK
ncbi:S-adenosylmethionine synthase [subsurface metagenome]|jgi:S-adenosylmethionine synthetase|uniref:methionine adenosyltransferase n=1 Tax=marine sediment metagenome TaxID=412755 RepID=X0ZIV9_9ZZZZ|nr:methionine adenosyltransferase [Clostridia bacterium]TET15722.1 MAG: methionine adenosyltransferase [Actinomycetota bacterium]